LFIELVEAGCPDLSLASPRAGRRRGSQVSFRFEHGYAAMQALIERGVIGDFRAPDIMRFGITPLYIDADDVRQAAATIERVMTERLWDNEVYRQRAAVT
jgi:kynureninase